MRPNMDTKYLKTLAACSLGIKDRLQLIDAQIDKLDSGAAIRDFFTIDEVLLEMLERVGIIREIFQLYREKAHEKL